MVLSSINTGPRHLVLTTSCAAVQSTSSAARSRWRSHDNFSWMRVMSLILFVLIARATDLSVGAATISPPHLYRDLPARISYFMEDGLTLNCSVLSDSSLKSYSYGLGSGGGHGKLSDPSGNQAIISWYKVLDNGNTIELQPSDERYAFQANGCQLYIQPIKSRSQTKDIKGIKGSYYCQAKNNYGETRSRKCVVKPVSSAISASSISISLDSASIYPGGTAVLSCKIQPEYAHSFYRIVRWEIISADKKSIVNNSTKKYSLVKSMYPSELHIRKMSAKDTKSTYRCVVESTIRQKDPHRTRIKKSPEMRVALNADGASTLRPYLQISHRHLTINARKGTSVELPCVYVSISPVQYTWFRDSQKVYPLRDPIQKQWRSKYQIVASDQGNLRITNLDEKDSGLYECKGSTSTDEADDHAKITLNVSAHLGVTVRPSEQQVEYSKKAEFRCHVHGYPLSRVYWLHDGQQVKPRANLQLLENNKRLVITKIDRHSAGVYQCFAEAGSAVAPDDNAQARSVLSVGKMPPQLVAQYPPVSADGRGHVMLGTVKDLNKNGQSPPTRVRLRCDFVGSPEPRITWYRDDERIPLSGRVIKLLSAPWKELDIDMEKAYQTSDGNVDKGVTFGGEYKAVATNPFGEAECRTFVEVDAKMTIRDFKSKEPPIEGQTFRLKCYVLGRHTFKDLAISWTKKDKNGVVHSLPNNHRHTVEERGRALVIKRVKKEEDDGMYTCTAKNKNNMKISRNVVLDVMRLPVINSFAESHHLNEGMDKVTVTCNIKNQADEPWYAWWVYTGVNSHRPQVLKDSHSKEGVRITYAQVQRTDEQKLNNVPSFVPPNTWVMLEIDRPEKSKHTGTYTCNIENRVGKSQASATITFKPKIKFAIKPPPMKEVILYDTLTLKCTAQVSKTRPTVEWKYFEKNSYVSIRKLEKATKKRISQDKDGTLVVRRVTIDDPTQFMCYVSLNVSDAEAISQVVKIKVDYPAHIRRMDDQERKAGEPFNLTCHVDGDGDIKLDWFYYDKKDDRFRKLSVPCITEYNHASGGRTLPCKSYATSESNGNFFQHVYRIKIKPKNDRGIIHRLTFPTVSQTHQTKYKCRARNKYNKPNTYAERVVKLTVISEPSAPQSLQPRKIEARSITLAWSKPEKDGNKPITRYIVTVYRIQDHHHTVPKTQWTKLNVSVLPDGREYIQKISGLHPAYEYRLEVAAVNDVGVSKVAHITQRTQEDKPNGRVQNISANGTSSDTIRITWNSPPTDKLNGLLSKYSVCLVQAGPGSTDDDKIPKSDSFWSKAIRQGRCDCRDVATIPHTKGGMKIFTGLPKFTKYYIRVNAHNSKGKSPPAFTYARTLEDVPRRPPIGVTCTASTTSVRLEWNPPNQDDMNGILTGYTIQYFETNEFEDESTSKILNISSNTYAEVTDLLEYTNYTFRIYAVNSKGSGPPSDPTTCHTKPSNPDPPAQVKVFPVNSSCLAVSWRHPNHSKGRLTEYVVRYTVANPMIGGVMKHVTVPANASAYYNSKIICGLTEGQEYNVAVQAKNHAPFASVFTSYKKAHPMNDAPARILAFNQTVITTNKVDLRLPCEHVGYLPIKTTWKAVSVHGRFVDGGDQTWLLVKKIDSSQSGPYTCKVKNDYGQDEVLYNVQVRVIQETPPNPPKLSRGRQRLHSVEVRWRPTGSARSGRKDTPISRYWLTYFNHYTKERRVVNVSASNRTYFLSNLTCGTVVDFTIKAENKVGNSTETDIVTLKTRGTRPIPGNAKHLIPNPTPKTSAYMNLTAVFFAGEGCMPLTYRIFVAPREIDKFTKVYKVLHYSQLKEQCCYNLTNLNAGSYYKYTIEARNAAGSENISAEFFTYTNQGEKPKVDRKHEEAKRAFWQRPAVLVGLIFILVVIVIIILSFALFWRRRTAADQLRQHEKEPVTTCVNDLKADGKPMEGLRPQFVGPRGVMPPPQSRIRSRVEEDEEIQSDDGSVDSDGNINPYATFATYESNTIDRVEDPDAGPRELGAVERESDLMRERLTRMQTHNSQKRKRSQFYEHGGPKQYENESVPGTLATSAGPKRRANSLEDLESAVTYNRGYATGGGGQMGRSFYDSKYTDQLTPYRGSSVISSTTMSSNHDELTQAYEYGRRARYESSLNTADAFNIDDNLDLHTGSGSSETTDPGIRQFTQQPPMPDEQRQATCEVPLFNKTPSADQRRTSINPSETYEAVDEAYYKRGVLRLPIHHPARQAPLPDLPGSHTLGRKLIPRGMHGPPYRSRADSDSVYGGPGHVYDSTDSYYSSYTPGNFGRRGPMGAMGTSGQHPGDVPRQRPMPSSRYYNGSNPSERYPLVGGAVGGATAAAARPHLYGAHGDPEEARSLLMNSRRFPPRNSSGLGSSTGGSGSGSSSVTVSTAGTRRPSRPTVPGNRAEVAAAAGGIGVGAGPIAIGGAGGAVGGAVGGPLIAGVLPGRVGDDSDSEAENIYTSEFTVV